MATTELGTVLRHIRHLAADAGGTERGDADLLRAFLDAKDQPAFEELVRRHGPMVLRVARRALPDWNDADDVFQATFIVLARQAASLRKRASLASWLHGVAYRMAANLRRAAARRHKHETRARRAQPADPGRTAAWQELRVLLDEEIDRLPETVRTSFVLCCLEGKNGAEVARQLGVREATVWKRLSRARKLLEERLRRRGVALTTALAVSAVASGSATAALPRSLVGPAVEAAARAATGQVLPGGLVSPNVLTLVEGVNRAMFLTKCKTAVLLLLSAGLVGAGLGLAALHRAGAEPPKEAPPAPPRAPAEPAARPPEANAPAATFRGRVLGPDGKPVPGAELFVVTGLKDDQPAVRATTGADGRFALPVRRGEAVDGDKRPLHTFQVVATAEGHGPAWVNVDDRAPARDLTLRLVRDDVPIEGRIVTREGKPVAGATVRVATIAAMSGGGLGPYLQALRQGQFPRPDGGELYGRAPRQPKSVTTDAEGRFRLAGAGRERIVRLDVEGPGIAHEFIVALTTDARVEVAPPLQGGEKQYGAKFEHRAGPGRTIRGVVR
jgi:RNA polymerase sigma factor (sigma-70 family)